MVKALGELSLPPSLFFRFTFDVRYREKSDKPLSKAYQLPVFSSVFQDKEFAKVFMSWSEEGVCLDCVISNAPFAPLVLEMFFDTKPSDEKMSVTKSCHHFICYPDAEDGVFSREETRLRSDDMRSISIENAVEVLRIKDRIRIFFPSTCLYGFDPTSFGKIRFNYCIQRQREKQYFAYSAKDLSIKRYPAIWPEGRWI